MRSRLQQIPMQADQVGRIFALARGGEKIADATREELITKLRANEYVPPFTVDALTFLQTDQSNKNYVRFTPRGLQRMAKSFIGRPFLRDHRQYDSLARGGTITASELVDVEGGRGLRQTLELVKPWAQEGVLDGTIDAFSIGWAANDPMEPTCSFCDAPMFAGDCFHWPGDIVTKKDGSQVTVEALFSDIDGVETSSVVVPAVKGTGIEGIRAALSAVREEQDPETFHRLSARRGEATKEIRMSSFVAIAAILGLAAETSEAQILDTIRTDKVKLETALAANTESKTALDALQAELAVLKAGETGRRIDGLILEARQAGKIPGKLGADGKAEQSALEVQLRKLAAIDLASAEAAIASLPRVVPVGEDLKSLKKAPALDRNPDVLSAAEKKRIAKLNISEKSYLAAKAEVFSGDEDDDKEKE